MSLKLMMIKNTTKILKVSGKFYVLKETIDYKMIWG